jgi:hypothetical protein
MRKRELDEEASVIFRVAITSRKKGSFSLAYQERAVIRQILEQAAVASGCGMSGDLTYDGERIGRFEWGPGSLAQIEAGQAGVNGS